tara:strand:+ start:241 stop:723 length:483 start_codon:yes stop_codon:yes gene_type:complete
MSTPQSILEACYELENEPFVLLYELTDTEGSIIRLSPLGEVTWRGNVFENIPCTLTSVGRKSNDEKTRPRFSMVNPEGMFTAAVDRRTLEGAKLVRYQLLKSDLDDSADLSLRLDLRITRVMSVTREVIVLESRSALDGAQFRLPYRRYSPPEFPHVRLK